MLRQTFFLCILGGGSSPLKIIQTFEKSQTNIVIKTEGKKKKEVLRARMCVCVRERKRESIWSTNKNVAANKYSLSKENTYNRKSREEELTISIKFNLLL